MTQWREAEAQRCQDDKHGRIRLLNTGPKIYYPEFWANKSCGSSRRQGWCFPPLISSANTRFHKKTCCLMLTCAPLDMWHPVTRDIFRWNVNAKHPIGQSRGSNSVGSGVCSEVWLLSDLHLSFISSRRLQAQFKSRPLSTIQRYALLFDLNTSHTDAQYQVFCLNKWGSRRFVSKWNTNESN